MEAPTALCLVRSHPDPREREGAGTNVEAPGAYPGPAGGGRGGDGQRSDLDVDGAAESVPIGLGRGRVGQSVVEIERYGARALVFVGEHDAGRLVVLAVVDRHERVAHAGVELEGDVGILRDGLERARADA